MIGKIKQIKKARITKEINDFFRDKELGFIQVGLTTIALSPLSNGRSIL